MKKLVFLLVISGAISACSSGSSDTSGGVAGPSCATLAGVYDNQSYPGETYTLNADCSFTDSICGYDASYTFPDNPTSANVLVTINNTNGTPGCLASTAHACVMGYSDTEVGVDCGGSYYIYLIKQ